MQKLSKESISINSIVRYNAAGTKPDVSIMCGEYQLAEGVDYKVTFKNNVKVGKKANATIKGIKNYSGSIKLTFTVAAKNMAEYADDFKGIIKDKGKYIITIKGKGNYAGELEEQYLSVY